MLAYLYDSIEGKKCLPEEKVKILDRPFVVGLLFALYPD